MNRKTLAAALAIGFLVNVDAQGTDYYTSIAVTGDPYRTMVYGTDSFSFAVEFSDLSGQDARERAEALCATHGKGHCNAIVTAPRGQCAILTQGSWIERSAENRTYMRVYTATAASISAAEDRVKQTCMDGIYAGKAVSDILVWQCQPLTSFCSDQVPNDVRAELAARAAKANTSSSNDASTAKNQVTTTPSTPRQANSGGSADSRIPVSSPSQGDALGMDGTAFDHLGNPKAIDADGCWDAPSDCIRTDSEWRPSYDDDKRFISSYENVCSHRVYLSFCHEFSGNRSASCGAGAVRPGRTFKWDNYWSPDDDSNPTGRFAFSVVGSVKPTYDWVCNSRLDRGDPEDTFD